MDVTIRPITLQDIPESTVVSASTLENHFIDQQHWIDAIQRLLRYNLADGMAIQGDEYRLFNLAAQQKVLYFVQYPTTITLDHPVGAHTHAIAMVPYHTDIPVSIIVWNKTQGIEINISKLPVVSNQTGQTVRTGPGQTGSIPNHNPQYLMGDPVTFPLIAVLKAIVQIN